MTTPTCITGFAGAGGADVGLSAAGFTHLRCCEWKPERVETLIAAGFPGVEADLSADPGCFDGIDERPDLGWFSPPCQDWSSAGKREGANGSRNGWPWTWAILDRLAEQGRQPTWLVCENVAGMLHHSGEDCGSGCCQDPALCPRAYLMEVVLPAARERYAWADLWVLDAVWYGVPQFRRRIFVVAGPHRIEPPQRTHGDPKDCRTGDLFGRNIKPWVTVRQALGLKVFALATAHGPGELADGRRVNELRDRPALTVPACAMGPTTGGTMWTNDARISASQNTGGTHEHTLSVDSPSMTVRGGNGYGVMQLLAGDTPRYVIGSGLKGSEWTVDKPSPTVRDGNGPAGVYLAEPSARRRLTVAECGTLQAFPTDYPFQGAQSQQYAQVGDAVPPPLAAAIAARIMEANRCL